MQNYQAIKVLGEGGYGKALLVKRKSDGIMLVMKEVQISKLNANEKADALREVTILQSLRHPNIIAYEESFQQNGYLYLVMEYADGGDLSQLIKKQGRVLLEEDSVLSIFVQIALAIKYLHDRKILHRDLKTQNIFLMKNGHIKLGDFGIARVLDHTNQLCKTQIGTPYYLSPEICEGQKYNSKTDIWSLGCILYELCTFKHPFNANNMQALLANIIRGKYFPVSTQYSSQIRLLISQMLIKSQKTRPSINVILATPFIKSRLNDILDETLLSYEMGHTILHGRDPLQAPTIIITKESEPGIKDSPPEPNQKIIQKQDIKKEEKKPIEMPFSNKPQPDPRKRDLEAAKKRREELAAQREKRREEALEIRKQQILKQKKQREQDEARRKKEREQRMELLKKEIEAEEMRRKKLVEDRRKVETKRVPSRNNDAPPHTPSPPPKHILDSFIEQNKDKQPKWAIHESKESHQAPLIIRGDQQVSAQKHINEQPKQNQMNHIEIMNIWEKQRMESLNEKRKAKKEEEDYEEEEDEEEKELSLKGQLACTIHEALNLENPDNESFDDEAEGEQGFPVAIDQSSLLSRIESMRNYLEKMIGKEKLKKLRRIMTESDFPQFGNDVDPQIIVVLYKLLALEELLN